MPYFSQLFKNYFFLMIDLIDIWGLGEFNVSFPWLILLITLSIGIMYI